MSVPLTRSQIHILSREKAKSKVLNLLKKHTIHYPDDSDHEIWVKKRNGKLRKVFVYNVPNWDIYIQRLNGEFRGKYRVYRAN